MSYAVHPLISSYSITINCNENLYSSCEEDEESETEFEVAFQPLDRNTNTLVHSPKPRENCCSFAGLNCSSNGIIRVTPPVSLLSDYSHNPKQQCNVVHLTPPTSLLSKISNKQNAPCRQDFSTIYSNPKLSKDDTFYSLTTDKGMKVTEVSN